MALSHLFFPLGDTESFLVFLFVTTRECRTCTVLPGTALSRLAVWMGNISKGLAVSPDYGLGCEKAPSSLILIGAVVLAPTSSEGLSR